MPTSDQDFFTSPREALIWLRAKSCLEEDSTLTPRQLYNRASDMVSMDYAQLRAAYTVLKEAGLWP